MSKFIGRVRVNEQIRAYRLPVRLPNTTVHGIDPNDTSTMYQMSNADHRSRDVRAKMNRVIERIRDHDVSTVEARAHSNYVRITLRDHPRRFIDRGNRFERIERILAEEFSLGIRDIEKHKWLRL